jgi:hypothetical protein
MNSDKKKYYALDDLHEIVSEKRVAGKETKIENLTREFFAQRRTINKKKKIREKI